MEIPLSADALEIYVTLCMLLPKQLPCEGLCFVLILVACYVLVFVHPIFPIAFYYGHY